MITWLVLTHDLKNSNMVYLGAIMSSKKEIHCSQHQQAVGRIVFHPSSAQVRPRLHKLNNKTFSRVPPLICTSCIINDIAFHPSFAQVA